MQGAAAEHFWCDFPYVIGDVCEDVQLLDKGKQAKHVLVQKGIGPSGSSVERVVGANDEGMMEMRDSSDVPRVTSQGTCVETGLVVEKMNDDHFNYLQRKPGGGGRACRRCLRRSTP